LSRVQNRSFSMWGGSLGQIQRNRSHICPRNLLEHCFQIFTWLYGGHSLRHHLIRAYRRGQQTFDNADQIWTAAAETELVVFDQEPRALEYNWGATETRHILELD